MIFVVVYGAMFAVMGLFMAARNRRAFINRGWIRRVPLSTIGAAQVGSKLKISGRVVPSEQGVFPAPCTGRPAVWARVRMERLIPGGPSDSWSVVTEIERGRDFFVEDQAGARARVVPRGAFVDIDPYSDAMKIMFQPTTHMDAFCAVEGIDRRGLDAVEGQVRYTEQALLASESVYVAGAAHRVPGMPTADGYRDAVGTELVLRAADESLVLSEHGSADIFITNVDEAAAEKRFRRQAWIATSFVVGGIVAMVCGAYPIMASIRVACGR